MRLNTRPDISVVVCTRNRAASLSACLAALARLSFPVWNWELVVVDNGSTDHTHAVVLQWAVDHPAHALTYVYEQGAGLGCARNAGIRAARGRVIACTDDDCYVAGDWLDAMAAHFRRPVPLRGPTTYGYLGGRVTLHDPTDADVTTQTRPYPIDWSPGASPIPGDVHGANLAFRKEVWLAIGGFDPAFGPGAPYVCDDIDFVTRASLAGYWGTYAPDAVVSHHHGRKPGPALRSLHRSYARGRGAYFAKQALTVADPFPFLQQWYWHLRVQIARRRARELGTELWAGVSWAWRYGPGARRAARAAGRLGRLGPGLRRVAPARPTPGHPRP